MSANRGEPTRTLTIKPLFNISSANILRYLFSNKRRNRPPHLPHPLIFLMGRRERVQGTGLINSAENRPLHKKFYVLTHSLILTRIYVHIIEKGEFSVLCARHRVCICVFQSRFFGRNLLCVRKEGG